MARWALLALLPTALADLETALAQEECTDPDTCSLQLLHVRGNKTESDLKADYQPGRETGVSCMWSNCEDKLGLVECHHWRCVCLPTAKWSSELLTCVKAEEPAEGQDTGGSCGWFACSKTRGPTRCERGKCQCTDGYVSFGGKCYQTTTTTTSQTETWPDAVISAPVPVPPPAPKQPPPKQISDGANSASGASDSSSSACEKSPGCKALGLHGMCCPNPGGVMLGCCGQSAAAASTQAPTAEAACDKAPKCAELGLQGQCCPNPSGVRLGCCP